MLTLNNKGEVQNKTEITNKGDNFEIFYLNNKNEYFFIKHPFFKGPYTQEDNFEIMSKKNPALLRLKEQFDLDYV